MREDRRQLYTCLFRGLCRGLDRRRRGEYRGRGFDEQMRRSGGWRLRDRWGVLVLGFEKSIGVV